MSLLAKAALIIFGVFLVWLLITGGIALARGRFHQIYQAHLGESRRERHFLGSLAFFLTFGAVRAITYSIRAGIGPFHDISAGGRHIHHLVWGILLLLIVGYLWLAEIGTGALDSSVWTGRITVLLYGVGAALTLDEFALWLNLADVYWSPQGRASIRAAFFFGSLLSVGFWGGPFLHALTRHALGLHKSKSR
ncbi:MAG TPA: hypothetical protein VFI82_12420 [Terriglobales bacterium]|jgi:hypothetical protein|nr:hypothetical protein [Terriglobales bacterium]